MCQFSAVPPAPCPNQLRELSRCLRCRIYTSVVRAPLAPYLHSNVCYNLYLSRMMAVVDLWPCPRSTAYALAEAGEIGPLTEQQMRGKTTHFPPTWVLVTAATAFYFRQCTAATQLAASDWPWHHALEAALTFNTAIPSYSVLSKPHHSQEP